METSETDIKPYQIIKHRLANTDIEVFDMEDISATGSSHRLPRETSKKYFLWVRGVPVGLGIDSLWMLMSPNVKVINRDKQVTCQGNIGFGVETTVLEVLVDVFDVEMTDEQKNADLGVEETLVLTKGQIESVLDRYIVTFANAFRIGKVLPDKYTASTLTGEEVKALEDWKKLNL